MLVRIDTIFHFEVKKNKAVTDVSRHFPVVKKVCDRFLGVIFFLKHTLIRGHLACYL